MSTGLLVAGMYKCSIWCLQAEQASVNTIYYKVSALTGVPVTDVDLARTVESLVAPIFKSVQSTDVSFRGVGVFLTNPPGGAPPPSPVYSNALAGPGTLTPPDCPRQVAGLISWRTGFGGRRFRGRFFMPFPSTSVVATDGVPTTAYQTVLTNLANALMGLVTVNNVGATGTATVALTLLHRNGKTPLPNPTPISGFIIPAKFATQRRRGSFGRANTSPI